MRRMCVDSIRNLQHAQAVERQLRGCVEEVGGTSLSSVKGSKRMRSSSPCAPGPPRMSERHML